MENVFEKLLKTYNTNYLDSLHIDLQEALKRESEEKQLSSGSKREILRQLIENHYDESKNKPTAQFIGGPFSLTVHWLPEYQKYIYIFGEQHVDIMDCDKFKQFDSHNIITPIEDYLYELIINTDVFIDFIFEIHTFDKSGEYPENYIPFETMGIMGNLYTKFQKCLQTKTRGHKDCKLSRIHYFDIRTESAGYKSKFFDIFWYKDRMETIIDNNSIHKNILKKIREFEEKNPYHEEEPGYLYFFYSKTEMTKDEMTKDEITRLWNKLTFDKMNKYVEYEADKTTLGAEFRKVITESSNIKYLFTRINNEKYYEAIWTSAIKYNKFIFKEKSREFENTDLKERITSFIMSEMVKIANRDKKAWQQYTTTILSIIEKPYTEDVLEFLDDSTIESYVKETISLLKDPYVILADFYTLLRIFKNFVMTDMDKAYTGATDQPSTASNIIIYAGDRHSDRYRRFLKEIGNNPIEKTGNFIDYSELKNFSFSNDDLPKNCIDMRSISQPFFNIPS